MLTQPLPKGRSVVAVSGGPDSTALLVALHEAGHEIVVAHYDHALRDGSELVARGVAELCAHLEVPLITERRVEPMPKGSLQAAARSLRYAFLDRARLQAGADVVALAHTADDVVEGVVLHLLRGCGIAGFRGMPARRGRYLRPLLNVWRSDVREFLEHRGLVGYEDPANADLRFARARVRHLLLPALERDRPGILRRFHAAATTAMRLHEAAAKAAAGKVTRARFRELPEPVAAEVLKLLFVRGGGSDPGLSRAHIDAMRRLAEGGHGGKGVDLPGRLRFRIVGDLMQVFDARPVETPLAALRTKACTGCDDREAAHLQPGLHLHVGYRTPGLRMRPAGGRGTRKLQDIFVDARVPREDRDGWPLVFAGDRLAWVPGLAVDADLASRRGEPGTHVAVTPMPAKLAQKVVRLENPDRPSGDQL